MERQIWITSDTHLGHDRDFIWGLRGFKNVYEHDEEIIKRWNSVVREEDIVYHLGDVMLGDNSYGLSCLKQLNGYIYIALGNHDTDVRETLYQQCHNVVDVEMGYRFKIGKRNFILSHYPQLVANIGSDKPIYSLHGHTHSKEKWSDVYHAYNVNLDAHDCTPVNINKILKDIKEKD
jgi:calcineurin-like phosphoesterase family protein